MNHNSSFYRSEGLLCPRRNCIINSLGVIWGTKEEADFIMKNVLLITRKFGCKSNFRIYPTAKAFMDDFLIIIKNISNKSI
ncbi:hypothetical protein CVD28_17090 [Bacillus sp. M6-12]|nr:hypothetical protein CVD28_17090 [Bacillus sp. M6-12]